MRVAEEIEEAQVALFRKIGREVLTDVRRLEVELEGLRVANARALERITRGEKEEEVSDELTMVGARWLESYCVMNIVAVEMRVRELREEVRKKEEILEMRVPDELLAERECLTKENYRLKEGIEALEKEFRGLRKQTEREKIELRAKIARMKTN